MVEQHRLIRRRTFLEGAAATGLGENVSHILADFIADRWTSELPQVSWAVVPWATPGASPGTSKAESQA